MTPVMRSRTYEPSLTSKQVKITYKVEFNSYIYDLVEYYDGNKQLLMDTLSVDGTPIDTRSYAIRNKLFNFIKDYRFSI
jgi:hypothetical protein